MQTSIGRENKLKKILFAKMLLLMLLLSACKTPVVPLENSARLMKHPQFEKAVLAAPDFTVDALKTINRLEYEIESRSDK